MEFLFRRLLFLVAFYPSRQPGGNKAAGGFFGSPLPSRRGYGCQPGAGWAESQDLARTCHPPAQRDRQSPGEKRGERETDRVAASKGS